MYEEKTKICPNCKREIDYYEMNCSYCRQDQELNFDDERALYIWTTVGTYLKKFERLDRSRFKFGWNWCGFLFGAKWMIYRKMYLQYFIFYFTPVLLELSAFLIGPTQPAIGAMLFLLTFPVCLILWIIGGLFSDYWYKRKIEKLMKEAEFLPADERREFARKKGGTSFGLLLLALVLDLAVSAINGIFLGALGLYLG